MSARVGDQRQVLGLGRQCKLEQLEQPAIALSRGASRKLVENLVWATGYNLVAIPLAAGVLAPWGIDLPMAVGAIAMSASTIIVAANAQLLRGLRLRPSSVAA